MAMTLTAVLVAELACLVIGAVFATLSWPAPLTFPDWGFPGFQGVGAVVFAASAWPIIRRRPRNPVGWFLLVGALLSAVQFAAHYYALYGVVAAPGSVPMAWVGLWVETWIWVPTVGSLAAFTLLFFPTGSLPSPRWLAVAWLAGVSVVMASLGLALSYWHNVSFPRQEGMVAPGATGVVALLGNLGTPLVVASVVAAAASVLVRFRSSSGVERQQLKWLALAASAAAAAFVLYMCLTLIVRAPTLGAAAMALTYLGLPVAIGVAIVRHGLYDIDHLINRALVYVAVTAVLGVVYAASVLGLQAILASVVHTSELAVAVSTLLVAGLFQPVRRRLQLVVDRRFYRSRYDAQRVADTFAARLRDEVELESVVHDLAASVQRTMHPAFLSVWIREP